MFISRDVVAFQRTLAFITLMLMIVFAAGSAAQDGMFSAGDAYSASWADGVAYSRRSW